ncbi:hypothetical protein EV174_004141 [Coemansia sp. RSA 2320]|nr:hypothetical protein EV174_004141 [Coemansia sp. RSA 2320]
MPDQSAPAKMLVVGSINGRLADFFAKVKKLDAKYGPFSLLLITGNLLSRGHDEDPHACAELDLLLKNELAVPIMTYVVAGDRSLPCTLRERASIKSGEICNNLVLLTGHGILHTSEGINIAYIAGRYIAQLNPAPIDASPTNGDANPRSTDDKAEANASDASVDSKDIAAIRPDRPDALVFGNAAVADLVSQVATENDKALLRTQAQPSIDIFLSYDWPYGAVAPASTAQPATRCASNKVSFMSAAIMPRYHFAAGEGTFFERLPWKYSDKIRVGRGRDSAAHFTRFIGLGAVNESEREKERWFYAMNVSPLNYASQGKAPPAETPGNCTPNPLFRFGRLGSPLDSNNLPRTLAAIDSSTHPADSKDADRGRRAAPPPLSYVCRCCSQPGHWIQDCPVRDQGKRPRLDSDPPAGYICHGCKRTGHWRADCPASAAAAAGSGSSAAAGAHAKCWFCLANPDVDQNLMAAIGDDAYVAMAKGALVTGGSAPDGPKGHIGSIPGGGHVLIVPIVHTDSLRRARESGSDADKALCAEVDQWIAAVSSLFAEHDCVPLIFETCRYLPHVHSSLQMVPIPQTKAAKVRPTLDEMCQADGLSLKTSYPPDAADGYLAINDPADGTQLFIHIPRKSRTFNLQFGRRLAAHILGVPEREDWKKCVVAEKDEAAGRDRFIAAFAKFDFTR